jgi:hypothetical protein
MIFTSFQNKKTICRRGKMASDKLLNIFASGYRIVRTLNKPVVGKTVIAIILHVYDKMLMHKYPHYLRCLNNGFGYGNILLGRCWIIARMIMTEYHR